MTNIIRHLGKIGDRKICVLFRKVPNEDHMCLVIYPDVMPAHWHDSIMGVLQSQKGQLAKDFADALHTSILPDGRLTLETLHNERMIKKVKTGDVIMTPTHKDFIRLDELNKMLDSIENGTEAIETMAKMDATNGLVDAQTKRAAEEAFKRSQQEKITTETLASNASELEVPDPINPNDLASNMLEQAKLMEQEAKKMIAQASRMKKEAAKIHPAVSATKPRSTKVTESIEPTEVTDNQG
jgi:hypothetical protein